MHKLTGMPIGTKNVKIQYSKHATEFIENIVGMKEASVEFLCSKLTSDLDGDDFILIFMLAFLAAIIAPNGKGFASPLYFQNLVNIPQIPNLNWCAFALNWLILCIKELDSQNTDAALCDIGGCKLILVVR